MNLVQDVLRIITVNALRNRTWCGSRAYDSPGEPADLRAAKERAPYIAVYVDDSDAEFQKEQSTTKPSLYVDEPSAILIIEVTVAGQDEDNPEADQDNDLQSQFRDPNTIAPSDAGLEIRIGLIMRQVIDALSAPDNPWSELWRTLVVDLLKAENRRGGSGLEREEEPAIRYASRVLRLHVGLLSEPAPGALDPKGFWTKFLALADQDERVKGISAIIRQFLEPKDAVAWREMQRAGTMTEDVIRGLGIGPAVKMLEGQPWDETPAKADNTGVTFIQEPQTDD